MERLERLQKKALQLTDKPGVYLMKNASGEVIYVGKAKRLKNRVTSYFRKNSAHNEKVRKMVSHVQDFDFIVTDSEFEALVLECSLIKQYSPRYNILLKDDKGYHYIKISDGPYPRITAEKQLAGGGEYIGPYTSSYAVKLAVEQANRVFKLPTCNKNFNRKSRPCLNYHIKRCAGYCTGFMAQDEYQELVKQAVAYIRGGSAQSIQQLTREMAQAAENLQFEQAIRLRDRIHAIEQIAQSQKIILGDNKSIDVLAMAQNRSVACFALLKFRGGRLVDQDDFVYYDVYDPIEARNEFISHYYSAHPDLPKTLLLDDDQADLALLQDYLTKLAGHKVALVVPQKGENRKLVNLAMSNAAEHLSYKVARTGREITALDELSKLLGLSATPERIEAYDISNLGDSGIVGGMVVFEGGAPKKSAYKKFAIHTGTQDDYASMTEMLQRRFARWQQASGDFAVLPDLILIDGGKGHVAAAQQVLEQFSLDLPCFGMVKDQRHRTRAIAKQGGEISISSYKAAFHLLTRIQDEVHRYTITYQKQVRKKTMLELELTKCKGIGDKKAAAIYKQFKTKAALKTATAQELAKAAKIGPEAGQALYDYIQQQF